MVFNVRVFDVSPASTAANMAKPVELEPMTVEGRGIDHASRMLKTTLKAVWKLRGLSTGPGPDGKPQFIVYLAGKK